METLRASSFGHPVRKSAETFSTLFLLKSSVLTSGRHSGTQSSFILLLKTESRYKRVVLFIFFFFTIVQLDAERNVGPKKL